MPLLRSNRTLILLALLAACGSSESADVVLMSDAGTRPQADAASDTPELWCEDSRTHLRGNANGADITADLCNFQYALVESNPWANWTKFDDGMVLLSGDSNIFSSAEATSQAVSGMVRLPSASAKAGEVFCGETASYYEARDESAPDAEITLEISGRAGACGGTGTGTLDLINTYHGENVANFSVGPESLERGVAGAYSDGTEFAFFIENGFVDVEVSPPLPDEGPGESTIIRATIALRDGSKRLLLACSDVTGTLRQTHSDLGPEFEMHLEGIAPWLDCANTEVAEGNITLTHDPRQ